MLAQDRYGSPLGGATRREGVAVRLASTPDGWKHTTKRMKILCADGEKGHLQIRVGLFEEVFWRESPSIRLWLVVYRDIVVAGALCLHARKHVVNWHGATSRSTLHFGPSIFYFTSAEGCVRGRI
jgi:hypothetical protein